MKRVTTRFTTTFLKGTAHAKETSAQIGVHRSTGEARVRIDRKDHYLGTYGSPESRQRYEFLIAQRYSRVSSEDCGLTIDLLCLRFLAYADVYYVKNGRPTNEPHNFRIALQHLIADSGPELVASFRAVDLKRVRSRMVESGWVRSSINKHVGRIRHLFRWGVSERNHRPNHPRNPLHSTRWNKNPLNNILADCHLSRPPGRTYKLAQTL